MAIISTGGGEAIDNGGTLRGGAGTAEQVGGVLRVTSEGTDTAAGEDTQASTVEGGEGNDSLVGGAGNDSLSGGDGNDSLQGKTEEDKVEGQRSDDEIRASLKAAGGIFADPRYEAGALEFEKTGDVAPETRAALATAFGVDPSAVDAFIEGQKAQRQLLVHTAQSDLDKTVADITSVIGDKPAYEKFMAWSSEALTDAEKNAYNEALDAAPAAAKVMLAGFNERYKAAGNGGPRDLTEEAEGGGGPKAPAGYASQAEMERDMNDTRYQTDEAFRQTVANKLAVSKF